MANCPHARPVRSALIWKPAGNAAPRPPNCKATIGDCVRYRKNVLVPHLPPPPESWRSLDFDRVEAELAAQSFLLRLARFLSPSRNPGVRWALSGAAVLVLSFVLVRQLRETPKVEAAALLQKAVSCLGIASRRA